MHVNSSLLDSFLPRKLNAFPEYTASNLLTATISEADTLYPCLKWILIYFASSSFLFFPTQYHTPAMFLCKIFHCQPPCLSPGHHTGPGTTCSGITEANSELVCQKPGSPHSIPVCAVTLFSSPCSHRVLSLLGGRVGTDRI